jgi:hypothetical protein
VTARGSNRLQYARNPAGEPIAEYELQPADAGLLTALADEARNNGARRLCVYSTADLSAAGFEAREGYRRFTASSAPAGDPLPVLDLATVRDLWPRSFIGQWGHHLVEPGEHEAVPGAIFVGLPCESGWLGICRVEPDRRHIDGPGFSGHPASPQAAQALVLGACAHLGPGPVSLETWGDRAEPYLALGFSISEYCPGWELALARHPHRPR